MMTEQTDIIVQIDIISDVMCPWCIVGYRQLERALGQSGVGAYVRWHPFELNPQMPPEGQNLTEHITEKYGSTPAQSAETRRMMTDLGASLGITFNFSENSRIVNTFAAHQLLGWAAQSGQQHPLKLALFEAHFTDGKDVSDTRTLLEIVAAVGLDQTTATDILASGSRAEDTRAHQQFWTARGVSGVPSMVFDGKYMLTGAQGEAVYSQMIAKVCAEKAAA